MTYRLALPPSLSQLHDVFHVSQLRWYVHNLSHILDEQPPTLKEDVFYVEKPAKIMDRKEQVLRKRSILFVKVQ